MYRKVSVALGLITAACLISLTFPGLAVADTRTSMIADAAPSHADVGDPVVATIVVTNKTADPIAYGTIEAPAPFDECAQDVGTLDAYGSATVTCTAYFDEPTTHRYEVALHSAADQKPATSVHNGLHVDVTGEAVAAKQSTNTPTDPTSTTDGAADTLPVTGLPGIELAVAGTLMLLAGFVLYRRYAKP